MIITEMVLHSAARIGYTERLCRVVICNDGTGTVNRGNYTWRIESRGTKPRVLKSGAITNWPRNANSAVKLLAKVMKEAYPDV